MKRLWVATALVLAISGAGLSQAPVPGQAASEMARLQAELQDLHAELNRARRARDRSALERIYAAEFRWVHGVGYADDREQQIANILEANSDRDLPPIDFAPPTEMMLFGDTVVMRRPNRTVQGLALYSVEVFVRRDGRWQILHIQGTPLQPDRTYVTLAPEALDALVGRYRNPDSGTETVITRAGDHLEARIPEVPIRLLRPVAAERFFDRIGTEYVFERGNDGRATGFTFRFQGGREGRTVRVP